MFNYILFSPAGKNSYVSHLFSYLLEALPKGFLRAYNF